MYVVGDQHNSQKRLPNIIGRTNYRQRVSSKVLSAISLYISCAVSHFYGTEYEIWADFGPVGCTENFELGHKVCYSSNYITTSQIRTWQS